MTVEEWDRRQERCGSFVIVVAKHKTGDKEPATLVINAEFEGLMQR